MECVLLPTFIFLVFGIMSGEGGTCPDNPSQAIQACAGKIDIDLNTAQGHRFITDSAYTKKMCEGDGISQAISCMETIYNDCVSSGTIENDLLIKPASWKMAVKEICDNRKFLTDNAACFLKSTEELTTCVEKFQKEAEADLSLKKMNLASAGQRNDRETFQIICSLSEDLITCFDKILLKNCPKKLEKIIDDVFYKFLPPVCHPGGADDKYEHVKDNEANPENGAVRLSAIATVSVAAAMCLRSMF